MNEQGPWISSGPEPDPEHRRGRRGSRGDDADWSGPESRGGDGFRGGPHHPDRRLTAGVAIILLALLSAAVAVFAIRSRTAAWPPPNWIFAACDVFPIESTCCLPGCCDRKGAMWVQCGVFIG